MVIGHRDVCESFYASVSISRASLSHDHRNIEGQNYRQHQYQDDPAGSFPAHRKLIKHYITSNSDSVLSIKSLAPYLLHSQFDHHEDRQRPEGKCESLDDP